MHFVDRGEAGEAAIGAGDHVRRRRCRTKARRWNNRGFGMLMIGRGERLPPPEEEIMMTLRKSILAGAVCLVGTTLAANAQPQYPAYPYSPVPVTPTPPSWSYDPYTSGLSPCPQWFHGDPPCRYTMPPTYGQPDLRR